MNRTPVRIPPAPTSSTAPYKPAPVGAPAPAPPESSVQVEHPPPKPQRRQKISQPSSTFFVDPVLRDLTASSHTRQSLDMASFPPAPPHNSTFFLDHDTGTLSNIKINFTPVLEADTLQSRDTMSLSQDCPSATYENIPRSSNTLSAESDYTLPRDTTLDSIRSQDIHSDGDDCNYEVIPDNFLYSTTGSKSNSLDIDTVSRHTKSAPTSPLMGVGGRPPLPPPPPHKVDTGIYNDPNAIFSAECEARGRAKTTVQYPPKSNLDFRGGTLDDFVVMRRKRGKPKVQRPLSEIIMPDIFNKMGREDSVLSMFKKSVFGGKSVEQDSRPKSTFFLQDTQDDDEFYESIEDHESVCANRAQVHLQDKQPKSDATKPGRVHEKPPSNKEPKSVVGKVRKSVVENLTPAVFDIDPAPPPTFYTQQHEHIYSTTDTLGLGQYNSVSVENKGYRDPRLAQLEEEAARIRVKQPPSEQNKENRATSVLSQDSVMSVDSFHTAVSGSSPPNGSAEPDSAYFPAPAASSAYKSLPGPEPTDSGYEVPEPTEEATDSGYDVPRKRVLSRLSVLSQLGHGVFCDPDMRQSLAQIVADDQVINDDPFADDPFPNETQKQIVSAKFSHHVMEIEDRSEDSDTLTIDRTYENVQR